MSGQAACDICGEEAMTNAVIRSEPTTTYHDGPTSASVPRTVVCVDCAREVSECLEARIGDTHDPPTRESAFSDRDADAILDRLQADPTLLVDPGRAYGVRYVDSEWRLAELVPAEGHRMRTLSRAEVADIIEDARRITLKQLDRERWREYESKGAGL